MHILAAQCLQGLHSEFKIKIDPFNLKTEEKRASNGAWPVWQSAVDLSDPGPPGESRYQRAAARLRGRAGRGQPAPSLRASHPDSYALPEVEVRFQP